MTKLFDWEVLIAEIAPSLIALLSVNLVLSSVILDLVVIKIASPVKRASFNYNVSNLDVKSESDSI
jgi:hypothetical protein